jgi:hypothetical protein
MKKQGFWQSFSKLFGKFGPQNWGILVKLFLKCCQRSYNQRKRVRKHRAAKTPPRKRK